MTSDSTIAAPSSIAVVGVGLIGGSIALAAHRRLGARVIGIGRDATRIAEAIAAGVIQGGGTDVGAAAGAELAVVCTPVDRIPHDVAAIAAVLAPGAVVTDVGSVKASICDQLSRTALPGEIPFVPSHPIAGSEKRGWSHADPDLFEGRTCVVTPSSETDPQAVQRISLFWESLGMRVVQTTPEQHDAALARTSHLPHLAAAALTSLLTPDDDDFVGSGCRDATRIASGDPGLWAAIFQQNAGPLLTEAQRLISRIDELRRAIEQGECERLLQLLREAQCRRNELDNRA